MDGLGSIDRWLEINNEVFFIDKPYLTIGRQGDITLDDNYVSRIHAHILISVKDSRCYIFDGSDAQPSKNGTKINSKIYRKLNVPYSEKGCRLRDGDLITIGSTNITYHEKKVRKTSENDTWF